MPAETGNSDWFILGSLGAMFVGIVPLTAGTLLLAWTGVLNRKGPAVGVNGTTLMAAGFTLLVGGLLALEAASAHRGARADLEELVPLGVFIGALGLALGVGPGILRESALGPLPSIVGAIAFVANARWGIRFRMESRESNEIESEIRDEIEPTGPDVPKSER